MFQRTLRHGAGRLFRYGAMGFQKPLEASDTVRGWDANTVTGRLENAVGRDLQYIRVNGTIVGGLVGVGLHAVSLVI